MAYKSIDEETAKGLIHHSDCFFSPFGVCYDYFVIASGSSTPQLRAMADEIDEKLSELGIDARRREGWETADWLLLDYETVIVHLFRGEVREFYSLERLWRDAQEVDISNMVKPN